MGRVHSLRSYDSNALSLPRRSRIDAHYSRGRCRGGDDAPRGVVERAIELSQFTIDADHATAPDQSSSPGRSHELGVKLQRLDEPTGRKCGEQSGPDGVVEHGGKETAQDLAERIGESVGSGEGDRDRAGIGVGVEQLEPQRARRGRYRRSSGHAVPEHPGPLHQTLLNSDLTIHYCDRFDRVPQVLKEDVRLRIRQSALQSFAERGYLGTTMAEVAARAGMATANLYRYYPSKADLFYDVVPDDLVAELERVVARRLQNFAALVNRDGVRVDVADEMMTFWLTHRLESVVVMAGAAGTRHQDVVARLTNLSVETLVDALPPGAVGASERDLIESIWANTPRIIARILKRNDTEPSVRAAITSFWQYQVAGLTALLRHLDNRSQ